MYSIVLVNSIKLQADVCMIGVNYLAGAEEKA
jgi:hypothetical protein